MNIFFLYLCAVKAARAQCDKHVVKMPLEMAQMLSAVWRKLHGQKTKGELKKLEPKKKRRKTGEDMIQLSEEEYEEISKKSAEAAKNADDLKVYKMTHSMHPMTVWLGLSMENFEWGIEHGFALCDEWKRRWHADDDKEHGSRRILEFMREKKHALIPLFSHTGFTTPPQCVPEQYKVEGDVVAAYRAYYIGDKAEIATWKYSEKPEFWPE